MLADIVFNFDKSAPSALLAAITGDVEWFSYESLLGNNLYLDKQTLPTVQINLSFAHAIEDRSTHDTMSYDKERELIRSITDKIVDKYSGDVWFLREFLANELTAEERIFFERAAYEMFPDFGAHFSYVKYLRECREEENRREALKEQHRKQRQQ
jgi:hypothetical protein